MAISTRQSTRTKTPFRTYRPCTTGEAKSRVFVSGLSFLPKAVSSMARSAPRIGLTIMTSGSVIPVEIVDGSVITDEGRIYSSGGANSLWNLLLYLLEKYTNRETAIQLSKYFGIDIDRNSQSAFTIFTGQKDHKDKEILYCTEFHRGELHRKNYRRRTGRQSKHQPSQLRKKIQDRNQ